MGSAHFAFFIKGLLSFTLAEDEAGPSSYGNVPKP